MNNFMKIYFLTVLIFMGMVTNANGRWGGLPMCGALQTPFRSILVGNEDEKFSIYGCSPLVSDISCDPPVSERFGNKPNTKKSSVVTNIQKYSLTPNPNDGNFILLQSIFENKPVDIDIFNATGISILKQQMVFENGLCKFNLGNVSPGLYLLQLLDEKGNRFSQKIIIKY